MAQYNPFKKSNTTTTKDSMIKDYLASFDDAGTGKVLKLIDRNNQNALVRVVA
jgi:hypothetical protein